MFGGSRSVGPEYDDHDVDNDPMDVDAIVPRNPIHANRTKPEAKSKFQKRSRG